jgi:integrase
VNIRADTKDTKSKAGKRTIGLPTPLVIELERHRVEQKVEREKARDLWNDGGWIFVDELGQKLTDRSVPLEASAWRCRGAGRTPARCPPHSGHDLELGVNDRATMDVKGWSSASMAGRYQHMTAPVRRAIADQVGGHLWEQAEGRDQTAEASTKGK